MPRGRSPGYGEQREFILAQAAELFARQGFRATSMNEVAEACGVSKPNLYHYFRDKYALLVDIAESHVSRLEALVDEVEEDELAPEERVRQLIQRVVEEYADAQNAHRVLTEDVKFLEPKDRKRIIDKERRVVAGFARAIVAVRPEMEPARLSKPLTMLLFGMVNWMFTWLRRDGELSHAAIGQIVADLFFGGVRAVRVRRCNDEHADAPSRAGAKQASRPRRRARIATAVK